MTAVPRPTSSLYRTWTEAEINAEEPPAGYSFKGAVRQFFPGPGHSLTTKNVA